MEILVRIIASFIAGIVTMPLLIEGYCLFRRKELRKNYEDQLYRINQEHIACMQELTKKHDKTAEVYNTKLSRMEKNLQKHNLSIKTDKNNMDIIVKRIPVTQSIFDWIKRK